MSKSREFDQKLSEECRVFHSAWNEISRVWTLPVIHVLGLSSPARFNELKRRIEGITATSLAERLTELEKQGIVERKVYPETPPRVEYSLTQKGWEFTTVLKQLVDWVARWNKQGLIKPIPVRPIRIQKR